MLPGVTKMAQVTVISFCNVFVWNVDYLDH